MKAGKIHLLPVLSSGAGHEKHVHGAASVVEVIPLPVVKVLMHSFVTPTAIPMNMPD